MILQVTALNQQAGIGELEKPKSSMAANFQKRIFKNKSIVIHLFHLF
jgi:hypothetical protein